MSPADSLRVMQEETDRGWHDPELMRLFLRLRHDTVREAAERNAEQWQDLQGMYESLENLRPLSCASARAWGFAALRPVSNW